MKDVAVKVGAALILLTIGVFAGVALERTRPKPEIGRYAFGSFGEPYVPFVLDTKTGQIWRYYRNTDSNGKPTKEGFTLLNGGPATPAFDPDAYLASLKD